ncbi:capsule assembly Wzi family protein [Treponema endosymbiont of Eucomonympha sp.]|uniref:capsule assembly Wzi family protein n=1 Tax=Treponema endosymbiont of Eucomonympha sp. TaxID=1580831 RepID=UPI000AF60E74|nr:capsule assembly Wzi family protein [Treponema endosymbiont of Eucomonympha sp.]
MIFSRFIRNNCPIKGVGILFFCALWTVNINAQEALKSIEEEYYDFLSLQGLAERPALNYRTLSDSVWALEEGADGNIAPHPWQGQNFSAFRPLFSGVKMRIYGPALFISGNTAAPYGQNDGALWQGRGFNASFTGGIRFEGYGVEATFKPQLAFSQNAAFDIMPPAYSGEIYIGKAEEYGYYGIKNIDAPQRFGDKPFFVYDWGDSEVRYLWKTVTAGFGTQSIWLGPAELNPIIHSNNAPSYPKLDIGLRRQAMTIPWGNWYAGDIETRVWWGYLSESDYFDNEASNDHNLITGFTIAYGFPSLLKGLSLGLNRIMLSKWDAINYTSLFTLLWPVMESSAGSDESDQRASVTIDYLLPVAGLNIYLEWARNDFSSNIDSILRYPFHTEGYTLGTKKALSVTNMFTGEILLEITKLECSQDYDRLITWSSTFYAHSIILQGHTNGGQWLGAGIGTGGNSQYLGFKLYFPQGYGQVFVQRRNPDLDYTYFIDSKNHGEYDAEWNIRAFLDFGFSNLYYIAPDLSISGSVVLRDEHNPLCKSSSPVNGASVHRYNAYASIALKYSL